MIPLFATDRRGRLVLVGSACAVRFGSGSYLITAGHVVEPLPKNGFMTFGQGGLAPIHGEVTSTTLGNVGGKATQDFDFGMVRLDGVKELGYRPSIFATVDLTTAPTSFPVLTFVGWPASRARPRPPLKRVDAELHRLTVSGSSAAEYTRWKLRPEVHILAGFRKEDFVDWSGNLASVADLHGMSGGGIFGHRPDGSSADGNSPLLGIIVGFKGRTEYLFGMRLNICVALMGKLDAVVGREIARLATSDSVLQALLQSPLEKR